MFKDGTRLLTEITGLQHMLQRNYTTATTAAQLATSLSDYSGLLLILVLFLMHLVATKVKETTFFINEEMLAKKETFTPPN